MGNHSIRRRDLLAGGATLVTGLAGCTRIRNAIGEGHQTGPPPLIAVKITNKDFEPYTVYLLVQTSTGEIQHWNEYTIPSATRTQDVVTAQSVRVGTGELCLDEFLVSVGVNHGEKWTQVESQQYRDRYEDLSKDQGASPEVTIKEGELTLHLRISTFSAKQCTNETSGSEGVSSQNSS